MRLAQLTGASLLFLSALIAGPGPADAELPTLEDYRVVKRYPPDCMERKRAAKVIFDFDDPFEFLVRLDALEAEKRTNVAYEVPGDGRILMIPAALPAIRAGLLAAKAYTDDRGYDTGLSKYHALKIWLDYLPNEEPPAAADEDKAGEDAKGSGTPGPPDQGDADDEDFDADPDAMFRGATAVTDQDYIWFNVARPPKELVRAAIHEWYHVLQDRVIKTIPPFTDTLGILSESTADWFTDQPIPFGADARRITGAASADGLNLYYDDWAQWWFPDLGEGLFRKSHKLNAHIRYKGVFLFKYFAEKVAQDDPDAQLKAIRAFLDAFKAKIQVPGPRGSPSKPGGRIGRSSPALFGDVLGEQVGGGRSSDSLRMFWADFIGANIEQVAGRLGSYRDDAFVEYCCPKTRSKLETGPVLVASERHYSRGRPKLEAAVAVGDDEVRQRLHEKLESDAVTIEPFATRVFAITLPGADPGHPPWKPKAEGAAPQATEPVEGVTKLFVQVTGEKGDFDDWTSALLTQNKGRRDERGAGVTFRRVSPFIMEPRRAIGTRSSAMARIKWFGRGSPLVEAERVWVGVSNLNPNDQVHELKFSYVVTPFFEPVYGDEADEDPRGTRTIRLAETEPEREGMQFRPGDRITLEIDLSDAVHEGAPDDIPAEKRALEVEVVNAEDEKIEVENIELSYIDPQKHRYRCAFTLPEEGARFGEGEVRFTVRSLLKLGEGDRNDDEFPFEIARIPPEVVDMRWERGGEVFYESEGAAFRPVTPGELDVRIRFDRDMDVETPASVKHQTPTRWRHIEGDWAGSREWGARYSIPEGDQFEAMKGFSRVSIQATSADGEEIDADPDQDDSQPDESHRVLIGAVPPMVTRVKVSHAAEVLYQGVWSRGPDLAAAPNLTHAVLGSGVRTLEREVDELPAEGSATIEIAFSQPLASPPSVSVGATGADLADSGDGRVWSGQFDLAAAQEGLGAGGVVRVEIESRDRFGNQLDADPRTVTRIGTDEEKPWLGWEHEIGIPAESRGGPDRWHELAEPPRMSLVIVLDASGSMKGDKMASAKQAIHQLLDNLPKSVELALIIFSGCGPPSQVVSFTREKDRIRELVDKAEANGGTGYAVALRLARDLLASSAHPGARILKYAPFSDGEETCDGDPIAAIDALEALIASRQQREEEKPAEAPPPVADTPLEIPCKPGEWEVYEARVRDGGLHLDRIRLVEWRRQERRLPDGHCEVTLSEETYGVTYGAIDGGASTMRWHINSRSSTHKARRASTSADPAALLKLRKKVEQVRARGTNLDTTKLRIEAAVRRSLERNRKTR